jgi:hypothetical protein
MNFSEISVTCWGWRRLLHGYGFAFAKQGVAGDQQQVQPLDVLVLSELGLHRPEGEGSLPCDHVNVPTRASMSPASPLALTPTPDNEGEHQEFS